MSRTRILIACSLAIAVPASLAAVSSAADTTLKAVSMTGSQESPKGDADGSGSATLTLKSSKVCYVIKVKKAGLTFLSGHIHPGAKGKSNPKPIIPLFQTPKKVKGGKLVGCSGKVKASDIAKVRAAPKNFYVNVHNAKYPAGALRGQLSK
ncbi:MAG: hypothetical protein QOE11_995 [Solirubrobacteraceae bacterium]|jgi:hypothetical protein|nr:hypothetical protein [Solirubrobacteraceae bacterium]